MSPEQKTKIDSMSYESMFSLWRNAPVGHPIFQGDVGDYFTKEMIRKRDEVGSAEHSATSKRIGWEGRIYTEVVR